MTDKKVIDWKKVIESGIDCEFWDAADMYTFDDESKYLIGPLNNVSTTGFWSDKLNHRFSHCRIRHNHKFGWGGANYGEDCPLPEGVRIRAQSIDKHDGFFDVMDGPPNMFYWDYVFWFEVIGLKEGYTWQ